MESLHFYVQVKIKVRAHQLFMHIQKLKARGYAQIEAKQAQYLALHANHLLQTAGERA
jgi:hypothetical protein